MYKAIKKIGEYNIGDIVPDKEAELWLEMYAVPHVEKFVENKEVKKEVMKEKESSLGNLLYDYLGRNQSVVKKNLIEDKLNTSQLKELLSIEEEHKKRPLILNTIKRLLKK